MSNCPNCGHEGTVGGQYCARCGSSLENLEHSPTPEMRRPSDQSIAIAEGSVLDLLRQVTVGEYEIASEIGRGGMAIVFLAHDIALNRKVAIKVMSPALLLLGAGVRERFKREAQTAAALSHPNIVPVYAVRESGDIAYFVMKHIVGRSLESVLKEVGTLPIPVVQTLVTQIGSALAYAHRKHVIHRDMKPGNVLLDAEGWVVVADFGIAKVIEAEAITLAGGLVGTPEYMSPEQALGGDVTGAADQYSLGVMAFEMLTGRLPFLGDSMASLLYEHTHAPLPPILKLRPDCPRALADVVSRMLEKDPEARWPTLEDAVAAIAAIGDSHEGDAQSQMRILVTRQSTEILLQKFHTPQSPVPSSGFRSAPRPKLISKRVTGPTAVVRPRPPTGSPSPPSGARRWIWPATLGGGLGAAAALIFALSNRSPTPHPDTPVQVTPRVASLEVTPVAGMAQVGDSIGLAAIGRDSSGAVLGRAVVTWESADPNIARVSDAGMVLGVAPGTTRITARHQGASATVVFTTTRGAAPPAATTSGAAVAAVRVEPGAATARVDETVQLAATVLDRSGHALASRAITWSSSAPGVATVTQTGLVTAVRMGNARITASSEGRSAEATVSVTEAPAASVETTPSRGTIKVGRTLQLSGVARDPGGRALPGAGMTWRSSDSQVATVSANGLVTGVGPGGVTISASSGAALGVTTLSVEAEPPTLAAGSQPPADPRPGVERALEQYRIALESRNLAQVRAAYPGMTAEQERGWREFFGSVSQLTVTMRVVDVTASGGTAAARVEAVYRFRSGRPQTQALTLTTSLERVGNGWRLVKVQ